MTEINKIDLNSLDIKATKTKELQTLFPEIFKDGKLDISALEREVGDWVESEKERYGLSWSGKANCMKVIQQSSTGTLRPSLEDSVEFDKTENILIEGDNLEVLKILQKSYYGKIKLIYIDPPYNTGSEFIYPDNFQEGLQEYLKRTEQIDGNGFKISTNAEGGGRYHTNWLNMMYPRLYLARNLLKDDGVIAIHIDEHESHNLKLVLEEIFGSENDLGEIIWDKKNPKGDSTKIATQHETIYVFTKDMNAFKANFEIKRPKLNAQKMLSKVEQLKRKIGQIQIPNDLDEVTKKYSIDLDKTVFAKKYTLEDARADYRDWLSKQDLSGGEAAYKYIDDDREIFRTVSMAWPNKKVAPENYFIPLIHPITKKSCPVPDRGWRNPPETMAELLKSGMIIFGEDELKQPERKYLLKDNLDENVPSVLPFGGSDDALLKKLNIPFDNPKPVDFASALIGYFVDKDGIVLDFFAGSGTTGHAVMNLNSADAGRRKFILIQLPEKTSHTKFPTISSITRERLKKVITAYSKDLLTDETEFKNGFKSFTLDSSNFLVWENIESTPEKIAQSLKLFAENINFSRSSMDLLYEILLKSGFSLDSKFDPLKLDDKEVFSIEDGALLICLEKELSIELVEKMLELNPFQIICMDEGFKGNDQLKVNVIQTIKSRQENEETKTIFRVV
jgi:adenine-specific DNA-methyltransferase